MSLVNYLLIGLLGMILGISLYMTKHDFSRSGALQTKSPIILT